MALSGLCTSDPIPRTTLKYAKFHFLTHLLTQFLSRTNWENYYMEITMIIGIIVYFLNFFTGKTKNQKIANQVKYKFSLEFLESICIFKSI